MSPASIVEGTQTLADGRSMTVYRLDTTVTPPAARRFLLTNPDGYSLTYNGLVLATEKRRSNGWQAFASYTWSKAYGLLPSSNASAAGMQTSTVSPPQASTFGRDPNDLTNARGRLPNDRPHMMRLMGSVDVPRTGFVLAANLQHFSGKPWTAAAQIALPQGAQRILLEPRGSRRLSSQTLLDLRVSRAIALGRLGRIDLLLDVLNLLNDTAEESLATETQMTETVFSPTFGQPVSFRGSAPRDAQRQAEPGPIAPFTFSPRFSRFLDRRERAMTNQHIVRGFSRWFWRWGWPAASRTTSPSPQRHPAGPRAPRATATADVFPRACLVATARSLASLSR